MTTVRAFSVWLLIILVETIHGILRTAFLSPAIGDFRARQVSVFTASVLILVITCMAINWVGARTTRHLLLVGVTWVVLTLVFELSLGRAFGFSWQRILEDYDLRHGGLMPLGLAVMALAPWIGWRLRR